jgi:hypothetical protein
LFENNYHEFNKSIKILNEEIQSVFNEISILKKALNQRVYNLVLEELLKGEDLTEYFNDIIKALYLIEDFKIELKTVKSLNPLQLTIMNYAFNENIEVMKNRVSELLEFIILYNIGEIEKEEEVKDAVSYLEQFDKLVNNIDTNIKDKQTLVRELILNKWSNNIKLLESHKGYKEFKRQANKKRALLPIRKYIEDYNDMLLKIFPCFLVSPEQLLRYYFKRAMFDIVILMKLHKCM